MNYRVFFMVAMMALILMPMEVVSAKNGVKERLYIENIKNTVDRTKNLVNLKKCLTKEAVALKFKSLSLLRVRFEDGSSKVVLPFHSKRYATCKATFCPSYFSKTAFLYLDGGQLKQGLASIARYGHPHRVTWKNQYQESSQSFSVSKDKSKESMKIKNLLCSQGLKLIHAYAAKDPGKHIVISSGEESVSLSSEIAR